MKMQKFNIYYSCLEKEQTVDKKMKNKLENN